MDLAQNFTCPLCLELAKDAVEISCCTKIFCLNCIQSSYNKYKQCPCCRSINITFQPSRIARKVISEIKIPCQFCQIKVQTGQMPNHLKKCPKVPIICRFCKASLFQGQIPKHTATVHQKQAKEFLIDHALSLKKAKNMTNISQGLPVQDLFKPTTNIFGLKSIIGQTGKFYCGGNLIGSCGCCDGHCGPRNGQNCDGCMELDVKRWNLARTYLVNPQGYICQIFRIQGNPRATCFRILQFRKSSLFTKGQSVQCKPGSPCPPCIQIEKSIKLGRYSKLI